MYRTIIQTLAFACLWFTYFNFNSASANENFKPQIWLGGVDAVVQKDRHVDFPADYMDMFKPNAPWKETAANTDVFCISTQMALRGTDDQLRTIFNGLRARNIAVAIELGLLQRTADNKGAGIEGFGSPLAVQAVAKRISDLGEHLDYVVMDEPVTKGHTQVGLTIQELVTMSAPKIALLKKYFPEVQIGLIDAVGSRGGGQNDAIIGFLDLLHKETGLKPAFCHIDVAWNSDWQPYLENLIGRLRARNIRTGVDFNGDATITKTDRQWNQSSLEHCRLVMNNPKTRVDDLIFGTWSPWPHTMMPETDPAAWTSVLRTAKMSHLF